MLFRVCMANNKRSARQKHVKLIQINQHACSNLNNKSKYASFF